MMTNSHVMLADRQNTCFYSLDLSFFLAYNEKERTRKEVQLMLTFENQNVEFKQEYVSDIRKEVIGFANGEGGTVYIGIRKDGAVLGVADPELLALIKLSGLDLFQKFFAGFPEVLFVVFVLFDGRDCAGGVMLFRHHVQLFAQLAVIDRNGLAVLCVCVGSGLAVGAQLDVLCGDAREIACQLIDQQFSDLRIGQGSGAVLFGKGIGGLLIVRINDVTGVRTIRVLMRDRIRLSVNGDRASRFVDGPLLVAVNIDNVADRLLGFAGRRLGLGSGPADLSGAALLPPRRYAGMRWAS